MNDRVESMHLELRRGMLALIVPGALRDEHYGYSPHRRLQEDCGGQPR